MPKKNRRYCRNCPALRATLHLSTTVREMVLYDIRSDTADDTADDSSQAMEIPKQPHAGMKRGEYPHEILQHYQ